MNEKIVLKNGKEYLSDSGAAGGYRGRVYGCGSHGAD